MVADKHQRYDSIRKSPQCRCGTDVVISSIHNSLEWDVNQDINRNNRVNQTEAIKSREEGMKSADPAEVPEAAGLVGAQPLLQPK